MMLVEDFKQGINNPLKEIQENTAKQVKYFKEETQKSLKELEENTTKQVMELNKTMQDLKMKVETIKNTKGRQPRKEIRKHRCKHQEQNTRGGRGNLRCRRFHRKHRQTIKENAKWKKILTQNIQEIQDTMRRPKLRIIGIEESEGFTT